MRWLQNINQLYLRAREALWLKTRREEVVHPHAVRHDKRREAAKKAALQRQRDQLQAQLALKRTQVHRLQNEMNRFTSGAVKIVSRHGGGEVAVWPFSLCSSGIHCSIRPRSV
jgi:hypothetical protein